MNKKILATILLLVATLAFAADKYISSSGDIVLKTATAKKVNLNDTLYTTQAGTVGIGVTPLANTKFSIKGNTDNSSQYNIQSVNNSGNQIMTLANNGELVVLRNGVSSFKVDASGNVGIGTASPGTLFEVKNGWPSIYHSDSSATAGYTIQHYTNTTGSTKATVGQYGVLQKTLNTRDGFFVVELANGEAPTEKFRINPDGSAILGTTRIVPKYSASVASGGSMTVPVPAVYICGVLSVISTKWDDATRNTRTVFVVSAVYGELSLVQSLATKSDGIGMAFTVTITTNVGIVITNNSPSTAQIFASFSGVAP